MTPKELLRTFPYQFTHATCVECGYHGELHDFAAKSIQVETMPALSPGAMPYQYAREIGDICAICWAKSRAER